MEIIFKFTQKNFCTYSRYFIFIFFHHQRNFSLSLTMKIVTTKWGWREKSYLLVQKYNKLNYIQMFFFLFLFYVRVCMSLLDGVNVALARKNNNNGFICCICFVRNEKDSHFAQPLYYLRLNIKWGDITQIEISQIFTLMTIFSFFLSLS